MNTSTFTCALGLALAFCLTGCQTTAPQFDEQQAAAAFRELSASGAGAAKPDPERLILREGDTVRISFPGAPNLNTSQAIRRDGKLALPLVGEIQAAGMTPADLEKKLLEVYGPQLQTKEVNVVLESSAFPVYVAGAVLRPGKIISDHPLSALEAVMEAGGFDRSRANLKKVRVIRHQDGKTQNFDVNLKLVMDGRSTEAFKLRPSDIIYVPEKFTWF